MLWTIVFFCLLLHINLSSLTNDKVTTETWQVVSSDVLFVIRSQHHKLSVKHAEAIKDKLIAEAAVLKQSTPDVLMMHEDWASKNAWTVLPALKYIYSVYKHKKWVFFCEDTTEINLSGLLNVLSKYDHAKDYFLGHALYDRNIAIIHHFNFYQNLTSFPFPDFDAGWAMSKPLLKKAVDKIKADFKKSDFSIDVKHEVAIFLSNQSRMSKTVDHSIEGALLTDVKEFCINKPLESGVCVSTVQYKEPGCGVVDKKDILIAVKTCEKFHKTRVPIIKKTVALQAHHIRYYSDSVDATIPTEYIGVPNTESGHCQKLHNIIKRSHQEDLKDIDWLVVVDDDTIMSFPRLQRMLACYDPSEVIIMGERYGYAVNINNNGYAYPTGGGGMILSRGAVHEIITKDICKCMTTNSPDDMWLGSCASQLRHPVIHSNSLHQAQAREYSDEFLSHRYLVSFHKHAAHEDDAPMRVYYDYLVGKVDGTSDSTVGDTTDSKANTGSKPIKNIEL